MYKELIAKYFITKEVVQPQRFSDLKREKSFGKILEEIHSRKSSCEREVAHSQNKNHSLFGQLIR